MEAPKVTFRQASFIDASISTLEGKLIGASIFVAVVLYFFLGTIRPVLISLTAIPVSILLTALIFKYFGLSINTMTLGGLAIAIGGLVDDAVVDVENVIRRLRANLDKASLDQLSPLAIVRAASLEVRTGIIYATAIIVLVFIPLFALPGIEGRLFVPLGIAFIVSTLASLLVSVTITPVLCFYLLPSMPSLRDHDTKIVTWLKSHYEVQLSRLLAAPKKPLMYAFASVIVAAASVPFMASSFLPPFNEGTLLIGLRLNPGVSLSESAGIASQAEKLVRQVPEVTYVGRRSGRAEGHRFGAGAAIGATEDHAGARPGVPSADDGDRPAGGGHAGRKPGRPASGGAADAGPPRARRPAQPVARGSGGSWRPMGGPDLLWPDRQLGTDQAADRRGKAGDRQAGSVRPETADRPSGSAGAAHEKNRVGARRHRRSHNRWILDCRSKR